MFESGLDPRGQNQCQRKEEVGVWPWGADVRPPPLPREADRDPQDWPPGGANAQVDRSLSEFLCVTVLIYILHGGRIVGWWVLSRSLSRGRNNGRALYGAGLKMAADPN